MTLSRKLVILAVVVASVLVVAAACCAYVLAHASLGPKDLAESPEQSDRREGATQTHVKAVAPRRDPSLVISVQQLLSVEPFFTADLRSQVTGTVRYVQKAIGNPVKRGEVLVALDVPDLEQDLREKEATVWQRQQDVRVARATAENARATVDVYKEVIDLRQAEYGEAGATRDMRNDIYARYKRLGESNTVDAAQVRENERNAVAGEFAVQAAAVAIRKARADFREKESAQRVAEADIELKQSLVEVARKNRDKAKALVDFAQITAPYDGVVLKLKDPLGPGSFVPNASSGQSESLMTIGRTDVVTLVMKVPDNAAPYVTLDTEAVIEISELPGVEIRGKVTRFSKSIQNRDRTMRVEVDLYNEAPETYGAFVTHAAASRLTGFAADSPLGLATLLAGSQDVWHREMKSPEDPLPTLPVVSGRQVPQRLMPGMSGYMRLNLRHFGEAYVIPSNAVFNRGGKPYLLEVKDGVTRLLPIHVQFNDGKLAKVEVIVQEESPETGQPEVLRELNGDDVILLNRQTEIGEGQPVKVTLEKW